MPISNNTRIINLKNNELKYLGITVGYINKRFTEKINMKVISILVHNNTFSVYVLKPNSKISSKRELKEFEELETALIKPLEDLKVKFWLTLDGHPNNKIG
jgi:hypothetical protein